MMHSSPLSSNCSPLAIGEDLAPLPAYRVPATVTVNFSSLLKPGLELHEDISAGCGGQLWPAGMVLAQHMLRYHRDDLKQARILELGAGGGLVGLAVASGCSFSQPLFVTDQQSMFDLMMKNIELNDLSTRVTPLVLNWGEQLPPEVLALRPNVLLAADCVYFEPAFPLLQSTLLSLSALTEDFIAYMCLEKRRKADSQFLRTVQKRFDLEEIEDQERPNFSRQGLRLYSLRKKVDRAVPELNLTHAVR